MSFSKTLSDIILDFVTAIGGLLSLILILFLVSILALVLCPLVLVFIAVSTLRELVILIWHGRSY